MKTIIDYYGEAVCGVKRALRMRRIPDESEFGGKVAYERYGEKGRCAIHRLEMDAHGVVVKKWAFGNWDERERLSYIPIDETMEVEI